MLDDEIEKDEFEESDGDIEEPRPLIGPFRVQQDNRQLLKALNDGLFPAFEVKHRFDIGGADLDETDRLLIQQGQYPLGQYPLGLNRRSRRFMSEQSYEESLMQTDNYAPAPEAFDQTVPRRWRFGVSVTELKHIIATLPPPSTRSIGSTVSVQRFAVSKPEINSAGINPPPFGAMIGMLLDFELKTVDGIPCWVYQGPVVMN